MLPDHESAVRRLLADSSGEGYTALRTLAEARAAEDGVVVLEGDWGGQIYATCPAVVVGCGEAELQRLLLDLDRVAWPSNAGEGARVHYEVGSVGQGIAGGMGGGVIWPEPWVHEEFVELGLADAIGQVLRGDSPRLPALP